MYAILKGMPQISNKTLGKFNEYMGYKSFDVTWVNRDKGEFIASPICVYEFVGEVSAEVYSQIYETIDTEKGLISLPPTAVDLEDDREPGMYIEDVIEFLIGYCKSVNHTGYRIELVPSDHEWSKKSFYMKNIPDRTNLQLIYEG